MALLDSTSGAATRLMFITQHDSQNSLMSQALDYTEAGGRILQLRLKDKSEFTVARTASRVLSKLEDRGQLVINDMWRVAREVGAWGVHLGLTDGDPAMVRRELGPEVVIGATAHNFAELKRAAALPVDYIGLGPLRFTQTKSNLSQILGFDGVAKILQQARDEGIETPIYIIGGVENQDVRELLGMGAFGVAVSGSIALASDPYFATQKFLESITKFLR
ncbi:MAG: thiamine phosphate synthase [Bacteroidia bacterium]|nr:MAG: thiamine phosphate synthase [Bacteroidia bacterium]